MPHRSIKTKNRSFADIISTHTHIRTFSVCFSSPSPIWFHFIRVALCWAVSRHFFFVCPFFSTEPVSKWCVCSCVKSFVSVNRTLGKRSTTVFHHPNYIRSMPGPGFAFRLFCPFAVPSFFCFIVERLAGLVISGATSWHRLISAWCALAQFFPNPRPASPWSMILSMSSSSPGKNWAFYSQDVFNFFKLWYDWFTKKKMQLIKQWACENAFLIMPWHLYWGSSWRTVGM